MNTRLYKVRWKICPGNFCARKQDSRNWSGWSEYWVLSIDRWVLSIEYFFSIDWWASRPEEVLAGEGESPSWSSCWRGPRWSPRTSEQVGKTLRLRDYSSHHQPHPPQANLTFKGNDVLFLRKKPTTSPTSTSPTGSFSQRKPGQPPPCLTAFQRAPGQHHHLFKEHLVNGHGLPLLVVAKEPKSRGL